jgi:RNA polymerase sigma-70 factor (ECF subfamily)
MPPEQPGLEGLLRQARSGDRSAVGKLLDMYRSYLTLMARLGVNRQLRGKLDPSDLVQETFLEAHRDFGQFAGKTEAELVVWLRQILARNLADQVRRYKGAQRRDVRLEQRFARDLEESSREMDRSLAAPQSSPSQQAVRREQAVLLAEALEQLPGDYREVIILRHLEGLRFPEIARRMDRSLDSVEKLWARALARLRRLLGERS